MTLGAGDAAVGLAPAEDLAFGKVYAYPNPALRGKRPAVHVELAGRSERVALRVYDVTGRRIAEAALVPAGGRPLELAWDDGSAPSGVYIYVVEAEQAGRRISKRGLLALVR